MTGKEIINLIDEKIRLNEKQVDLLNNNIRELLKSDNSNIADRLIEYNQLIDNHCRAILILKDLLFMIKEGEENDY